ncbi:MAG: hypothetical protein J6A01_04335 [Proteobacteria bacterium]|nr:hypothetical protein [Pseudomonadota bacterium]
MSAENHRYSVWVAVVLALICVGIGAGIAYLLLGLQSSDNAPQAEPNAIVQPQPGSQNNTTENIGNTVDTTVPEAEQDVDQPPRKTDKKNIPSRGSSQPRPKDADLELPF